MGIGMARETQAQTLAGQVHRKGPPLVEAHQHPDVRRLLGR